MDNKELILKTANRTALKLLIQIAIGFALVLVWGNNMLMTYWLIFSLANAIFVNEYYMLMAKEIQKLMKEGKVDENPKGE